MSERGHGIVGVSYQTLMGASSDSQFKIKKWVRNITYRIFRCLRWIRDLMRGQQQDTPEPDGDKLPDVRKSQKLSTRL